MTTRFPKGPGFFMGKIKQSFVKAVGLTSNI